MKKLATYVTLSIFIVINFVFVKNPFAEGYEILDDTIFTYPHNICIDPGHGGPTAQKYGDNGDGLGSYGYQDSLSEQWINLQVAYALQDSFWYGHCPQYPGQSVVMTRLGETDIDPPPVGWRWRIKVSNYGNAGTPVNEFISIHHNGFPPGAVQGTETFWCNLETTVDSGFFRDTSSTLANKVRMKIHDIFNIDQNCYECYTDRGTRTMNGNFVLTRIVSTHVLSEASDISEHPDEEDLFEDPSGWHIRVEANGIHRGWCSYKGNSGIAVVRNSAACGVDGFLWIEDINGRKISWNSPYTTCWEAGEFYKISFVSPQMIGGSFVTFHHLEELETGYYSTVPVLDYTVPNFPTHTIVGYYTGGPYSVSLSSPNGGESWATGSQQTIAWGTVSAGADSTTLIDIHIDRNTGNDGYTELIVDSISIKDYPTGYPWTVAGAASTKCRIRIIGYDVATNQASDTSDADFTIVGPSIEVVSPNGGEEWQVQTSHNITWSSVNFTDSVKLEYSTNEGSNWMVIVDSTSNDGSFWWNIPDTPSTQCRVKISDSKDGNPSDMSDANFTISPGPLNTPTISTPIATCDYPNDIPVNLIRVSWNDNNDYEDGYEIWRKDATDQTWAIIDSTPADHSIYEDTELVGSETYSYKIRAFNQGGTSGFSNTKARKGKPNPPRNFNHGIKWVCAGGFPGGSGLGGGIEPDAICPLIPSNWVILSWQAPDPQKLPIQYYDLYVNCRLQGFCTIHETPTTTRIEVCVKVDDSCYTQLTAFDSEGDQSCSRLDSLGTFGCYQKCTPVCGGDDTPAKLISEALTPSEFSLCQNYPNPFNAMTRIEFALPEAGKVRVEIFNILGERVIELLNKEMQAGFHSALWDGTDKMHNNVSSGVYLYRIEFGNSRVTRKMLLLK